MSISFEKNKTIEIVCFTSQNRFYKEKIVEASFFLTIIIYLKGTSWLSITWLINPQKQIVFVGNEKTFE